MGKSTPNDHEIFIEPGRFIISKSDSEGKIISGNELFIETSGYTEKELIGKQHSLLRHPDMPGVMFKLIWDRIVYESPVTVLIKNLTKDGSFYWTVTEFETKKDKLSGKIKYYTAIRRAAPKSAVKTIEPLYVKLAQIETRKNMNASEAYLIEFLEEQSMSYDDFIDKLVGTSGSYKSLLESVNNF